MDILIDAWDQTGIHNPFNSKEYQLGAFPDNMILGIVALFVIVKFG